MTFSAALLLDVIALVGGTVHTLVDGAPAVVATVLIEDGRIRAVGPDLTPPEGAKVIDLAGLHVAPGLVDGVVSFEAEHDALYLDAGVTLVRDHGSPYGRVMGERDIRMRDRNPGPYLLVSGPALGGSAPSRADAVQLVSPAHAVQYLERTLTLLTTSGAPVDALTVDGSIDAATLKVVGVLAERRNVHLFGPKPQTMTVEEARAAGQRVLVGLDSILPRDVAWTQEADLPDLTPLVRSLADGEWIVAPLLYGTARILREPSEAGDTAALARLSPTLELAWLADARLFAQQREQKLEAPWRRALQRQRAFVRALHEAGVQLLPGTGAPSPWIPPGRALVLELGEWAAAGIPGDDILRLATRDAARALGHGERRGLVVPEYSADLVVLGSDPRVGPAAFDTPELVLQRGRPFERFELEELVEALATKQAVVRAELAIVPELELPDMPEGDLVLSGQVDNQAFGRRMSTERFAVVQLADGAMVYGVRVEVPGSASDLPQRLHLVQTIRDGVLDSFELEVGPVSEGEANLEHLFGARGRRVGATGKMTIERRFGRKLVDTATAEETLALVDMSTVVSGLVAARHFPEGASFVLSFEGAQLESTVDRWRMRVRPEDKRIEVLTTRGFLAFGMQADGIPRFGIKQHGEASLELGTVRAEVRGGAGFGLPAERVFQGDRAVPAPTSSGGGAPKGDVDGG
jgi:hypothetical protein